MPLLIYYRKIDDYAEVCGVYGDSAEPVIPETLDGLPVRAIGRYCFAPNGVEPKDAVAVHIGDTTLIDCTHRICGNFVRSVVLPDNLRLLQNAAFYNCRKLKSISVGRELTSIGSDLFTNAWEFSEVEVRSAPNGQTPLKKLLAVLPQEMTVIFSDGSRLCYPEFYESMDENLPAHVFVYSITGTGYRYRQCFNTAAGTVSYEDYDKIFPLAVSVEGEETLTRIAAWRLGSNRTSLSDEAAARYTDHLSANAPALIRLLAAERDGALTERLGELGLMDRETLMALADAAAEKDWPEGAALARTIANRLFGGKKRRYEF